MERRKRTTANRKLDAMLVWRIRQMIIQDQWSPEQIRGVLAKENISVSVQCIYNIIKADHSGELRRNPSTIPISGVAPRRSADRPKPPI